MALFWGQIISLDVEWGQIILVKIYHFWLLISFCISKLHVHISYSNSIMYFKEFRFNVSWIMSHNISKKALIQFFSKVNHAPPNRRLWLGQMVFHIWPLFKRDRVNGQTKFGCSRKTVTYICHQHRWTFISVTRRIYFYFEYNTVFKCPLLIHET